MAVKISDLHIDTRIGYDFYCDIAEKMYETRKLKKMTQEELSKLSGISLSRIKRMELVQIRFTLPDLEKLANTLNVSLDWLISAEIDSPNGECRYIVWNEKQESLKIYQDGTSPQIAFFKWYERFRRFQILEPRDRAIVRLVGIPVSEKELAAKFKKRIGNEDDEIIPNE